MTVDDETEARILEKAEHVDEAVTRLVGKQEVKLDDYLADWEERAVVERTFQTAIEACIDVAALLLTAADEPVPETNAEKFARLAELDVLSEATADQMQNAAGFRNVLAHNYGHAVNDRQVYRHLQEDLHWFPTFLREVRAFLEP